MPRPSCDPCCNPGEMSRTKESFQASELIILCSILAAIEAGSEAISEAIWAYSATAAAALTAAFTNVLTSSGNNRYFKFTNTTDQDIEISFDGTNVHIYLVSGEIHNLDIASNGMYESSNVFARYVVDPSSGSLFVSAARGT